jgi:hypothetical protein
MKPISAAGEHLEITTSILHTDPPMQLTILAADWCLVEADMHHGLKERVDRLNAWPMGQLYVILHRRHGQPTDQIFLRN